MTAQLAQGLAVVGVMLFCTGGILLIGRAPQGSARRQYLCAALLLACVGALGAVGAWSAALCMIGGFLVCGGWAVLKRKRGER